MSNNAKQVLKLDHCPVPVALASLPASETLRLPSDPGILAMTDFQTLGPATINASRTIDDALRDMMFRGVRALLVSGDASDIAGLITSYDIQGERPLQFLQKTDHPTDIKARGDIHVRDIMTPISELRVLTMDNLNTASMADVASLSQASCLTHILVVDQYSDKWRIRGIISASRLQRSLGIHIESICAESSFADLAQAIGH